MIKLNLPEGLEAVFTTQQFSIENLYAEEATFCKEYSNERQIDFCRGRYCAHKSLDHFGMQIPILKHIEGYPVFPSEVVGSISHTQGFAGAIVALSSKYKAVGIDVEKTGRITKELWPSLFTHKEQQQLLAVDRSRLNHWSTLFFSAKEAFFKMQFPHTGKGMEFNDLEVYIEFEELLIKPKKQLANWLGQQYYSCKYCFYEEYVIVYCLV